MPIAKLKAFGLGGLTEGGAAKLCELVELPQSPCEYTLFLPTGVEVRIVLLPLAPVEVETVGLNLDEIFF
jgi:hypothetical protein